ncbi:MAG: AIR synthase-related protein [Acidimicrobiales bacterium]
MIPQAGGGADLQAGGSAYLEAGVDYDILDAAKRRAIAAAEPTLALPSARGASVIAESIGEPVSLVEMDGRVLAVVLECLGTKSVIAGEVQESLGLDRFSDVGVDAVAAIVNDMCCAGALPVSLNAYFATGSARWYTGSRHASLVEGWSKACAASGAAWVGGESPSLAGIVEEGEIDIAGSALGAVPAGCRPWTPSRLEGGDEIVLVSSSGLHANGSSLARRVAAAALEGWRSALPSGRALGEAVLDPSLIYVDLVEALQREGGPVHYASHVTGHGLRKLMRAPRELTYRIDALPEVPEVLSFLAARAGLAPAEAYATFNMGVGFALYVAAGAGDVAVGVARRCGHEAILGGVVERGPRRVVLEPIGVSYGSEQLALR